jgi:hypothetical protein
MNEAPRDRYREEALRYRDLRDRLDVLERALEEGNPLEDEIGRVKAEVAAIPRGHFPAFLIYFAWTLSALTCLLAFYWNAAEPMAADHFGSPDSWYLERYRPVGASVWSFLRRATATPWSAAAVACIYIVLWSMERRLPFWRARALMRAAGVLTFVGLAFAYGSLCHLLLMPLCRSGG